MSVDIAGFVTDLKEHATEHGFHVHDERHFVETYSLRQSWEVDLHPEAGCGGPIDLHVALDVDPKVILSLREALDEMDSDFEEPENVYHLDLFFNWAVPPLHSPPDLLVLATDLAGLAGVTLPVEVSAIDSYGAVTDAPERRLTLTGEGIGKSRGCAHGPGSTLRCARPVTRGERVSPRPRRRLDGAAVLIRTKSAIAPDPEGGGEDASTQKAMTVAGLGGGPS